MFITLRVVLHLLSSKSLVKQSKEKNDCREVAWSCEIDVIMVYFFRQATILFKDATSVAKNRMFRHFFVVEVHYDENVEVFRQAIRVIIKVINCGYF